jgi:hypothetical protein
MNSAAPPRFFKPFDPTGDIRCGTVRFDAQENMFRISMGGDYAGTYDMEADRILSGGGFLDFLLQVHSKEWVTGQHLKDLLDCVTCWVYRDHGQQFPQGFFDVIGGMNRGLDDPGKI